MVYLNDEDCVRGDQSRHKVDVKIRESFQCRPSMDEELGASADKTSGQCPLAKKFSKRVEGSQAQATKERRQLMFATMLCFAFMLAEILGGYMAGSLAIMSDAAHLLSDCISFIVALLAICLAKKSPDKYMTFGYKRIEVLGAIISIFGIWLLTAFLFYFALNRIVYSDFEIDADTMIAVSIIGIIINVCMAIILHGEGLSCVPHSHSHGNQRTKYHNNNKSKQDYKPLLNEQQMVHISQDTIAAECDSGRVSIFADLEHRRHSGIMRIEKSFPGKLDRSLCVTDGTTICPIHNYIHRDSSENTPLNSDSEDGNSVASEGHSGSYHSHGRKCDSDFSSKNINIQAAVIHVLGDFIQSIGVLVSAIIIKYYPNAKIADPLCTFVFSIIVIMTTCTIMKESIGIILEAVPTSISVDQMTNDMECIEGVRSVHELRVWSLTVGHNHMSAHFITDPAANPANVLREATAIAMKNYNIERCTIQIETSQRAQSEAQTKPDESGSIISIIA